MCDACQIASLVLVMQSLEARIVALEDAATEVTSTDAAAVSDVRDYQMHMLHNLRQIKGTMMLSVRSRWGLLVHSNAVVMWHCAVV